MNMSYHRSGIDQACWYMYLNVRSYYEIFEYGNINPPFSNSSQVDDFIQYEASVTRYCRQNILPIEPFTGYFLQSSLKICKIEQNQINRRHLHLGGKTRDQYGMS